LLVLATALDDIASMLNATGHPVHSATVMYFPLPGDADIHLVLRAPISAQAADALLADLGGIAVHHSAPYGTVGAPRVNVTAYFRRWSVGVQIVADADR